MNYRDHDYQRCAQELAEQDYDDWCAGDHNAAIDEWMQENAHEYIQGLLRGGDYAAAMLTNMRKDCIYYLTDDMDKGRVFSALCDQGTEPYDEEMTCP